MGLFGFGKDKGEVYFEKAMKEWNKDKDDRMHYLKAYDLFLDAIDKGYYDAIEYVARMHYEGLGVPQDYEAAAKWLKLGVQIENIYSINTLANMYIDGRGVPQDYEEAVRLLRIGVGKGSGVSNNNLGYMYENGFGTAQDYAEAMRLYRKAAEAGSKAALVHLGKMYEEGEGVDVDYIEALKYYREAEKAGNKKAPEKIEALLKKMEEQKKEAEKPAPAKKKETMATSPKKEAVKANPAEKKEAKEPASKPVKAAAAEKKETEKPVPKKEAVQEVPAEKKETKIPVKPAPVVKKAEEKPAKAAAERKEKVVPKTASVNENGYVKRNINIGTIGPLGSGKTTLTSAITAVMSQRTPYGRYVSVKELDSRPEEKDYTVDVSYVEYETEHTHFTHLDCPAFMDYTKHMVTAAALLDVAVLVVSAADDEPLRQLSIMSHVLAAREQAVPSVVVFINKCDLADDPEFIEQMEEDIRYTLDRYGYPAYDIPVILGSAKEALEDPNGVWGDAILELLENVETTAETPEKRNDLPFFMTIRDVYNITARGTVVTGRIERGVVQENDEVEIIGLRDGSLSSVVRGIRLCDHPVKKAESGDIAGLMLRGISRDQIKRGMALCCPGTVRTANHITIQTYFQTRPEGGRHKPLYSGYEATFVLRTARVTGKITLPDDIFMIEPGQRCVITVDLQKPVVAEPGMKVLIMEGAFIVGYGTITAVK